VQGLKRHDLKEERWKGLGRGLRGESGTGRRSWDIIMTGSQVVTLGGAMEVSVRMESLNLPGQVSKGISVPNKPIIRVV
jgi:hypothetical protein